MRVRPAHFRLVFVFAAFAIVFGASEAGASASAAPVVANDLVANDLVANDRQAAEVGATHDNSNEAGIANASRLRRFAAVGAILGTLLVLSLWLSWPCATRVLHARPIVARFSIRRRGPPSLLAAA